MSVPTRPDESGNTFEVWLVSPGTKKINMIKNLRSIQPGWDLLTAKTVAETPPRVVASDLTESVAQELRDRLMVDCPDATVEVRATGRSNTSAETRLVAAPPHVLGSLAELPAKIQQLVIQHINPTEQMSFTIVGTGGQSIVALADRLLVVKSGFLAGATFGGRVTSFTYADISGVQVNTGMMNGSIEIHTAGMGATKAGDFWSKNDKEDPWKLPNCIPIVKASIPSYQPFLEEIRSRISKTKQSEPPVTPSSGSDLADQLAKLHDLHQSGALSDSEFESAKRRVLGDS